MPVGVKVVMVLNIWLNLSFFAFPSKILLNIFSLGIKVYSLSRLNCSCFVPLTFIVYFRIIFTLEVFEFNATLLFDSYLLKSVGDCISSKEVGDWTSQSAFSYTELYLMCDRDDTALLTNFCRRSWFLLVLLLHDLFDPLSESPILIEWDEIVCLFGNNCIFRVPSSLSKEMLFFEIWDGWFSTSLTWITSCKLSVGVFFLIVLEFLTLPFLRVFRRYCDSRVLGLLSFLFFSLDFTKRALLECCDFSDCFDFGDYRDLLVPDMLDRKDALELWLLSDAFGDLDLTAMSVF